MSETKKSEILRHAGTLSAEMSRLRYEMSRLEKSLFRSNDTHIRKDGEQLSRFKSVRTKLSLVSKRWIKQRRVMEDGAKLEQDFVDALVKEIEKRKVPIITRDTKAADIRIGSRLYEFKALHSKGELTHIKLIQLQKIHPDILEPTHKIRWNHMFDQVKSYCQINQTHTIRPSDDKRKEKLRWWLSNQIKLINSYFKQHDNRSSDNYINFSRHEEMTRRDDLLTKNGLKANRVTGRVHRSSFIRSIDPDHDKRRLIDNIDRSIKLLRSDHNTDYFSILKERAEKAIAKQERKYQRQLQSLRDSRKKFEDLQATTEPVSEALSDDHKPY